ncbi:tyrosine--tRNA ligase [Caldiplasma sukawensis]
MVRINESLYEEIITKQELETLDSGKGYIGFEPSGIPHIASIFMFNSRISNLIESGVKMDVLLADWHAAINDKLNGDMDLIRESGELLKEAFKKTTKPNPSFIWASDLISKKEYFETLIRVGKNTTLSRLTRALPIMGRTEKDAESDFSKYIYPIMQATDIFVMNYDIAIGGMDQRHAHMLQRDVAEKLGRKKVISLHVPLLGSLKGSGRMDMFQKMSKSDPGSTILITDNEDEVKRKISKAFCPMNQATGNPVIDILQYIIIPSRGKITIPGKEGDVKVENAKELKENYENGSIHPSDLKEKTAQEIIEIMKPLTSIGEEFKKIQMKLKK